MSSLKDDNLRDWEYVLGRIYNPFALTLLDERPDIRGLISMMRIGRKYGFDTMFRTAVDRLLSDFVKFNIDIHFPFVGPMDAYKRSRYTGGDLFLAINAALEFDIETILPVAYYLASFDAIYTADDRFSDQMEPVALSSRAENAIIPGKQKLLGAILAFVRERLTEPFQPSSKCSHTLSEDDWTKPEGIIECTQAYNDTPEPALASFCEEKLIDALSPTDKGPTMTLFSGLCLACDEEKMAIWEAERKKLWTELPKFYGLAQSWEELKWYEEGNP